MRVAVVGGDDVVGEDPDQLSAALAAQGHDTTVYLRKASRRSAQVATAGSSRSVSVSVGPREAASPVDLLPYVGDWAAKLERAWSREQPDVVHAYGWLGGLAGQLTARRRRIPVVQTFLGLAATTRGQAGAEHNSERQRVEPLLARSAAWVTGESSDDVDALARFRHSRTRVSSLTCGVDALRYAPIGSTVSRNGPQRILCVTPNPLWCNGIDIAIQALAKVRGAELVIAENEATNGRHDHARSRLQHLATGVGVADRVRFVGTVANGELPNLIRSADVVVCTPRQPPRATAALEAMATGVAVAAAAVGVLADVILDDITGLIVPPENPIALAAALRRLLGHSFQRESMGAAGRSRAMSRFAWERIALDALNLYGNVGSPDLASMGLQPAAAR